MHSQTTPRWMAAISLVVGSAAEALVSHTDRDTLKFPELKATVWPLRQEQELQELRDGVVCL